MVDLWFVPAISVRNLHERASPVKEITPANLAAGAVRRAGMPGPNGMKGQPGPTRRMDRFRLDTANMCANGCSWSRDAMVLKP